MSEPTPLAAALAELIARKGLARAQGNSQLAEVWKTVAGEKFAGVSRALSIQRGVLEVAVRTAAAFHELETFHRRDFVNKLKTSHPQYKIRDIKFRLKTD